ncbi:hypothetical protein RQP46_009063 [Phenoliferia psychrophenolica]
MSDNQDGGHGQPGITLAAELIDEILGHLAPHPLVWSQLSPTAREDLKAASLVSRAFRGPAQRRLMLRAVIHTGTHAKRLADGLVASGLHVLVKHLEIDFSRRLKPSKSEDVPTARRLKASDTPTLAHFIALLPLLPNVTTLRLMGPTFPNFRPKDLPILRAAPFLPHLQTLHVAMQDWQTDTNLLHDILSLTPSLTSLSLTSRGYTPTSPNKRSPVNLPHLETLDLDGATFPSSLADLALLSANTFARIQRIHWSLDYWTYAPERDMAAELQSCTALQELRLGLFEGSGIGLLHHIPASIQKITFTGLEGARDVLADLSATSRPVGIKKVVLEPQKMIL